MNRINYTISALALLALAALQSLAQSTYETYFFTTLSGGGGFSSPNTPGSVARFSVPLAVAVDSAGNLYVAEQGNHTVSKVTPAGAVTTFAGRPGSFGSADGTASAARFYGPSAAAVDSAGNVYVADTENCTIRKVTPAGELTTLAGLAGSPGSANGTGSAARFSFPFGVAVDGAGNVYVADTDNHTIRRVTPAGAVTTLAGLAGSFGSANGTGSAARFYGPSGAALDHAGNVYVADSGNHTIRKVTPARVVTTLAGLAGSSGSADGTNSNARFNFPNYLTVDSATNLYVTDWDNHTIRKMTPVGRNWVVTTLAGLAGSSGFADGMNSDARFNIPSGVALDSAGNLYVADVENNAIRKLTPEGTNWMVTTVAGLAGSFGSANGTNSDARFNNPWSVAVDSADNVYVADYANSSIRKMTLAGTNRVVTTLAGTGGIYGSAEGTGLDTRFNGPSGVAEDSAKNFYVADQINHTIRKVTPAGVVTTLAGLAGYAGSADGAGSNARFRSPSGLAVDSADNVYVADTWNSTIRKVTPAGVVTTLAGLPGMFGGEDGTNSQARFLFPQGVAVDNAGNLYVADTVGSTIRKVTPLGTNWVVTTLAGRFDIYDFRNGTGTDAWFHLPSSVAVDSAGNVYVADTINHIIRKVTPAGVVTTFVGGAGAVGSVDGTGTAARFYAPTGVAVDSADNVYVADTYNNTIRKITPARVVTTLGGMPDNIGTANGTGSAARFSNPAGLAVDGDGNVYVADFYFNTIRKGFPAPMILNSGFTGGQFSFNLTGPTGHLVVVEASPDLVSWLPIWTNTSTLNFSDPQSGVSPNRFYRSYVR